MAKYRITYDRDACIGAAACAALDPKRFEMNVDGKADLKGGKEVKPGLWVLEVDSLGEAQEAADGCPVDVIKVEEL
ncbi:ferredoxin [Candidatus Woesearchaeota archaeon]|nr:ferredoxin [Candidatus Woesearchaeota archaeon]